MTRPDKPTDALRHPVAAPAGAPGSSLHPEPVQQQAHVATRAFTERYGRKPRWLVAAPGRVNVIGEHTDYNEGYVLPMAIECYTVVAADGAHPNQNGPLIRWHTTNLDESVDIPLAQPLAPGQPAWANYVRGVVAGFQARGSEIPALDVLARSTVPLGGGLSSSASLEVAAATLLETVSGTPLDPVQKALLCQKAEHEFAGVPCGIMDQFTSALAQADHLLLLDCRSRVPTPVPLTDPGVAVLIVNTNVKHELATGEYARRRAQCETAARALGVRSLRDADADALAEAHDRLDPVVYRRAKHVISEIERTQMAAAGVRHANWPTVGALMYASHESLRADYEVSCAELDAVVDIAQEIGPAGGVIGCRMTGGGFGGCAVSLVRVDALPEIVRVLDRSYRQRTGRVPSLFVSRPAAGAQVLNA